MTPASTPGDPNPSDRSSDRRPTDNASPGNRIPSAPSPTGTPEAAAAAGRQPPSPLSGRRVLAAGLVSGTIGLALSFFLQAVVANTPVRITSLALFWTTVLLSCIGFGAGMALEAVRQLSENNPDPAYRRSSRRGS
jgi:hypothetical protein